MEIQKVENTEYIIPKMGLPRPSKGKIIEVQKKPMLYSNENGLEVGIPLRTIPSNFIRAPFSMSNPPFVRTKIVYDEELVLIARYPGIELQYTLHTCSAARTPETLPQYHFKILAEIIQGQNTRIVPLIYERFPENLKADSNPNGAHEYTNLGICCGGTAEVVLPCMPQEGILDKRLHPHTNVKRDSLLVKEEVKYAEYENKNYQKNFPLPDSESLTPQEYHSLIAQIHPIPYWDF